MTKIPRAVSSAWSALILESRDYHRQPTDEEIPAILDKLEDKVADILSRQAVERSLEKRSKTALKSGTRSTSKRFAAKSSKRRQAAQRPPSKRKLEKLDAMEKSQPHCDDPSGLRPRSLSEIIGQGQAVEALASRISSPYPQHLLLYGPPGVGKTTAARLVLEEAKKSRTPSFKRRSLYRV